MPRCKCSLMLSMVPTWRLAIPYSLSGARLDRRRRQPGTAPHARCSGCWRPELLALPNFHQMHAAPCKRVQMPGGGIWSLVRCRFSRCNQPERLGWVEMEVV